MLELGVILVLIGSAAHAGWNALIYRVPNGGRTFVWIYSALTLLWVLPVAAIVLLLEDTQVEGMWVLACLVSALAHLGYALVLQWAYSKTDMSLTYPIARGVAPLLVTLIAIVFLGQVLTPIATLGIGVIIAGVFVVSSGLKQVAREFGSSALPIGAAVGGLIAAYTLWDSYSITTLDIPVLPYYAGTTSLQFLVLTAISLGKFGEAKRMFNLYWKTAIAVAVLVPVSYLLVLLAMRLAPVSIVAALRGTSIVMGVFMAWYLLKEPVGRRRLIGSGIVTAGVIAIALSSSQN
ncbi:MAG TPA: EamA family transporter [Actinobacteria bacterium]|nr:EamA family transporter [Actinomycetota bacterium]